MQNLSMRPKEKAEIKISELRKRYSMMKKMVLPKLLLPL
jgi:hypothetical protein